ncbi:MAG: acetyltransferase, family [Frankiales bacterium]|jgi:RimJ/RimL family protein N-acetyltransferase|nr:acetyltransferase, family [Frankiales bacterium]
MSGQPARDEGTLLTRLRPARPEDAALLAAWRAEPCSPYEDWTGPTVPGVSDSVRQLPPVGGGDLVVTDGDDQPIGTVSWHSVTYGPNVGSQAWDIGISLRPFAQGRGHGSRAQRMLARYLFTTTPAFRVQATTDVRNVPEQRALERAGFLREGVLRGAQWRQGGWHDLVSFARLRDDR